MVAVRTLRVRKGGWTTFAGVKMSVCLILEISFVMCFDR